MPSDLVDEPDVIVQQLLSERKKLIDGYFGNPKNDRNKLKESLFPAHYAISLSGEPTMYPKLPQLIKYLRSLKETKSIFLVTNGQEPEMLYRLAREAALPTQLYLSTNASNKRTFYRINRPRYRDAWERWLSSLRFLATADTRTVLRMTLIRDHNDQIESIQELAGIVGMGDPHFIELKSYMHIGMSTQRLQEDAMLEMDEVRHFSIRLASATNNFAVMDESEISRIVVLQNEKRRVSRWIDTYLS
jgi:tRNA wybutosine-synthesizing protein 1